MLRFEKQPSCQTVFKVSELKLVIVVIYLEYILKWKMVCPYIACWNLFSCFGVYSCIAVILNMALPALKFWVIFVKDCNLSEIPKVYDLYPCALWVFVPESIFFWSCKRLY